jgi:hypothetical protein
VGRYYEYGVDVSATTTTTAAAAATTTTTTTTAVQKLQRQVVSNSRCLLRVNTLSCGKFETLQWLK